MQKLISSSHGIQRLDFRLPEFTRYAWTSDHAREVWEPRVHRIIAGLQEVEWRSIVLGLRSCALRAVMPEQLCSLAATLESYGLKVEPLQAIAITENYSASMQAPLDGQQFGYWSVLGRQDDIQQFKQAYEANDQPEIGRLLGYPPCCTEFFADVWIHQGFVDTTWAMAHKTQTRKSLSATTIEIPQVSQSSMLLRWLGPRQVFHLPCRFDCEATAELANRMAEVWQQSGLVEELSWLNEMLRWPVEWSALHGIAEIKTPVVKISTRTDATAEKYAVRYLGDTYPHEGARGLHFPYQQPAKRLISDSQQFRDGLDNPVKPFQDLYQYTDWYFTDNGFFSKYSMDSAHKPILTLARQCLQGVAGRALDLGCGNGVLMRKIWLEHQEIVPGGVDVDPAKIAHAQELLPEFASHFGVADMFASEAIWSSEQPYALVILMLGRLTEVPRDKANWLLEKLQTCTQQLLVYAYDDYLRSHTSLNQMATDLGIELIDYQPGATVSLAKINL
jgi:hypothetical protein